MTNYKELIKSFTKEDYESGRVNLHIHTTYSDGKADFMSIVEQAKDYKAVAISDHNTIQGHLDHRNIPNMIPAVEFDAWFKGVFMHLLAYGFDVDNEELKPFLAKSKKDTEADIVRIFARRNVKKLIEAIHNSGGIAVLAHPACCFTFNLDKFIKNLKDIGLDGVEAFYEYHRHRGIIKFYRVDTVKAIGEKYNMILTGGTDLHGVHL